MYFESELIREMARLLLLLMLLSAAAPSSLSRSDLDYSVAARMDSHPKPFPPTVERLNGIQRKAMKVTTKIATVASAQATPALLALLNSDEMRSSLRRCCPSLVNMSSQQLLDELRGNVETAELVHTFDGSFDVGPSIEMNLYNATEYFPTQWQMRYLRWAGELWWYGQPNVETTMEENTFHLPPFRGDDDTPTDYTEASSRLVYVTLNMLRIDSGNRAFGYGNVTAVLSPSYWRDAVSAAPTDTGFHGSCCNDTWTKLAWNETPAEIDAWCDQCMGHPPQGLDRHAYCHATKYGSVAGVRGAMDHALLANDRAIHAGLGRSSIARLFARWHGVGEAHTNVSGYEAFDYIEANVLANLIYKERAIKLLVGSFPALFGTPRGRLLQQWATERRIALSWAYGTGRVDASVNMSTFSHRGAFNVSFRGNERMLDATVGLALQQPGVPPRLNSSVDDATAAAFESLWAQVTAARGPGAAIAPSRLWSFWESGRASMSADMRLALPAPRVCADWTACVGSTPSAGCVCYV